MAVDLSRIGLEGIETGQRTLNSIETRRVSEQARETQQMENDQNQRILDLQDEAAARLSSIASGEPSKHPTLFDGVGEDDSTARPLEIVADTLMRGGATEQAMEYSKAAADIRKKESDINTDQMLTAQRRLENVAKTADIVSKTIGVAGNESEWRWGLQQLRTQEILPPEQIEALEAMEYDEGVVAYLNEQAMTAYQRATLDLNAAGKRMQQAQHDDRNSNARRLADIAEGRLEVARTLAARTDKEGKSASAPTKAELDSAKTIIASQIFEGKPPTKSSPGFAAYEVGAQAIASRAQTLVRADKSIDWETAVNRAVIESQVNGDWEVTPAKEGFFGFGKAPDKTTFDGTGKVPDTAVPLPMTSDGKPDASKLRANRYYITAKGRAKWNGSAFELAPEE